MQLRSLATTLASARIVGDERAEVTGVQDDSRAVRPGDLFVAVPGRTVDGHDFAAAAVERGAVALCVERTLDLPVPQLIVLSASRALGRLAAELAGRPADRMTMIGLTGTNGKTTTSYLVEAILRQAGATVGVIGTVDNRFAGRVVKSAYTTPTAVELQALLAEMAAAGCTHVVMEATSSALALDRLEGIRYHAVGFTNLTQDHLEVHGTMEAYFAAKARLFSERMAPDGVAAAMIDDPRGDEILGHATGRRLRVSGVPGRDADVRVVSAEASIRGVRARIATPRGELDVSSSALLGDYNVANLALAVALTDGLVAHDAIARGIAALPGVPGRVERVGNQRGVDLLVDYAHTPDALERVIGALRPLTRKRLIVVFGCGGDRDPSKRPVMGRIVAEKADVAVVTSDNPRTEEPTAIIGMIVAGMTRDPDVVEPDRRRAIELAVAAAREGDVILVAGKGHEDYQVLGKTKIHFDDREEAARAISALPPATTLDEVAAATGGRVVKREHIEFGAVGFDGRTVRAGDLYVAIRGERLDGHDFAAQAAAAGATGFLVEKGRGAGLPGSVVEVDDTRTALGLVGQAIRRRWGGPLVGVTGSTGKTTTKQLIAAALGADVLATEGSFNNETGLPLTLCKLRGYHRFAVCEMGMRGPDQIDYLARLAEPDVGVVVNVGVAHLEQLGTTDAIARAKSEIWGRLRGDGHAIFPDDDPRLTALAEERAPRARRITFGWGPDATVRIVHAEARGMLGSDATIAVAGREVRVHVPLVGRHNLGNAACALAVAHALGVDAEAAAAGIARAHAARQRGELAEVGGRHVLVDCYNANPASMRAGLETLAELASGRRAVAVVGDMLELGSVSADEHAAVGDRAAMLGLSALIAVGERSRQSADAARAGGVARVVATDDPEVAARAVLEASEPGDWVLIKASRGMRLERVLDALRGMS